MERPGDFKLRPGDFNLRPDGFKLIGQKLLLVYINSIHFGNSNPNFEIQLLNENIFKFNEL